MRSLHLLAFDYGDGEGIDFEPFDSFMAREEAQRWLRAWTGNRDADASDYLIFGQDGSGGYAAIWNILPDHPLLEQPIVFFGSEGDLGVVASDFSDYLWLLASNHGPSEAVSYPDEARKENAEFVRFAEAHAVRPRQSLRAILAQAHDAFPGFSENVMALCR
jgi:hypothetical protein